MKKLSLAETIGEIYGLEAEICMIEDAISRRYNSWCRDLLQSSLQDRQERLAIANITLLQLQEAKK